MMAGAQMIELDSLRGTAPALKKRAPHGYRGRDTRIRMSIDPLSRAMEKSWDGAAIAVARKGRPSQTRYQ